MGHELGLIPKRGPRGPAGAGPGPEKKPGTLNGSGPGMEKPGPNPTRCHSYIPRANYRNQKKKRHELNPSKLCSGRDHAWQDGPADGREEEAEEELETPG